MRELAAIEAAAASGGEAAVTGGEVAHLCKEIRRVRKALATVRAKSNAPAAVLAATRALRPDPLGIEDPGAATGLDGYAIRSIDVFERGVTGREGHASGLTAREIAVLVVEVRRLRQAVHAIKVKHADACPRTRRYATRVLDESPWARGADAQSYPPPPSTSR